MTFGSGGMEKYKSDLMGVEEIWWDTGGNKPGRMTCNTAQQRWKINVKF
jgi:hypothetical protein